MSSFPDRTIKILNFKNNLKEHTICEVKCHSGPIVLWPRIWLGCQNSLICVWTYSRKLREETTVYLWEINVLQRHVILFLNVARPPFLNTHRSIFTLIPHKYCIYKYTHNSLWTLDSYINYFSSFDSLGLYSLPSEQLCPSYCKRDSHDQGCNTFISQVVFQM